MSSFFFTYSLFLGPYFIEPPFRWLVTASIQILTYILIAVFLSYYLGSRPALLLLATILCFLSYPGLHYPSGAAGPILFHIPILLFFLGSCVHLLAKGVREVKLRAAVDVFTFVCVLGAVSGYEPLYVAFALIEGIVCYTQIRGGRCSDTRFPLKRVLLSEAPALAALTIYPLAYLGYRALHPSIYPGTTVGGGFNLATAAGAAVVFAISGLPGGNCIFGPGASLMKKAVIQYGSLWQFVIARIGWKEVILSAGAGLVVWLYLRDSDVLEETTNRAPGRWLPRLEPAALRRRAVRVAALAMSIAFCVQVPLIMSSKYRDHVMQWAPYVPSFFAFLSFCVAAVAVMTVLSSWLHGRSASVAALCAVIAMVVCGLSREASALVLSSEANAYSTWELVDLLMRSRTFAEVKDGSTIIAPNLWDNLDPTWDRYSDYWSEYVYAHAGRKITILRTMPELKQMPRAPRKMLYLEKQLDASSGQPVLLLSDLYAVPGQGAAAIGSSFVSVLSEQPLNGSGLVFEQTGGEGGKVESVDQLPMGFLEEAPVISRADGSGFVSTLNVPDNIVSGSAYLVGNAASLSSNKLTAFHRRPYEPMRDTEGGGRIVIDFGRGFSAYESDGVHQWHWSDGQSGTGEIVISDLAAQPVEATLEFCVVTGYAQPSKLLLEFQGKPETVPPTEGRCPLARRLTFQPGPNRLLIHSFAPRLLAPNDPRYIVFGVRDWKLTPSPARVASRQ